LETVAGGGFWERVEKAVTPNFFDRISKTEHPVAGPLT
jgi:hypothetical protein